MLQEDLSKAATNCHVSRVATAPLLFLSRNFPDLANDTVPRRLTTGHPRWPTLTLLSFAAQICFSSPTADKHQTENSLYMMPFNSPKTSLRSCESAQARCRAGILCHMKCPMTSSGAPLQDVAPMRQDAIELAKHILSNL